MPLSSPAVTDEEACMGYMNFRNKSGFHPGIGGPTFRSHTNQGSMLNPGYTLTANRRLPTEVYSSTMRLHVSPVGSKTITEQISATIGSMPTYVNSYSVCAAISFGLPCGAGLSMPTMLKTQPQLTAWE